MTMFSHSELSPYLNRFTTLWQDKADVKLDFTCKGGQVIVNLSHNLGGIEKVPEEVITQNPNGEYVRKKNVSLSQILRLKKRATERAAAEKLEAEKVKAASPHVRDEYAESKTAAIAKCDAEEEKCNAVEAKIAMNAKVESEKTRIEGEKSKQEAEESRSEAEQARIEAEEARNEAEQARMEAEQAKGEAEKLKSEAEQAKGEAEEAKGEAEKAKIKAEEVKNEAEQMKREAEKALARAKEAVEAQNEPQHVDNEIKETFNSKQTRTDQIKNIEKDNQTNIEIETEALGPRKVGRFLMSGKLKQNHIEEDLEELQENEVHLPEEK